MQLFLCHCLWYGALSFTHFHPYICLAFGFHFLPWANYAVFEICTVWQTQLHFSVPPFPFWRYAHWFALKKKNNYFLRFLLNNVSSGHAFVPFSNFSFQWRNVLRFLHNVFFSYSNTMYIFLLFQIYAPL